MGDQAGRKKFLSKGWLVAFLVPFFVIGGLSVWHWYDYGLKDIHTARSRFAGWEIKQPGDETESLKFALMIGTACGIAAGALGLGAYGIVKFVKKKT
ncbi:MAG TPA: hypothetical protein V6C86_08195 [Oculatellaceae cyanobacterium]